MIPAGIREGREGRRGKLEVHLTFAIVKLVEFGSKGLSIILQIFETASGFFLAI